jgi:hypothetical protein
MVGAVAEDDVQKQLEMENEIYGDIVQGNFIDSYRNMTYKHTMVLKWFLENCSNVKYLLKTDDDIFVNIPELIDHIEGRRPRSFLFLKPDLMLCDPLINNPVGRGETGRHRVTWEEYSRSTYPHYCNGPFVLYSTDSVFKLYKGVQRLKYFWIDDIQIGVVAEIMNVDVEPLGDLILNVELERKIIEGKVLMRDHPFLAGRIEDTIDDMRRLWNAVK